jgi:hypothetical protein
MPVGEHQAIQGAGASPNTLNTGKQSTSSWKEMTCELFVKRLHAQVQGVLNPNPGRRPIGIR